MRIPCNEHAAANSIFFRRAALKAHETMNELAKAADQAKRDIVASPEFKEAARQMARKKTEIEQKTREISTRLDANGSTKKPPREP